MADRLFYETQAGQVSPEITFKQLTEYVTLLEEDFRELAKLRKIAHDDSTAMQWMAIANNFKKVDQVISHLANSKTRSSLGFTSAKTKNRS